MNDFFEIGLKERKATLGDKYVEKNLNEADDFTKPFQEAMTSWCWGFGWGDHCIDRKTRSMMNLTMMLEFHQMIHICRMRQLQLLLLLLNQD